MMLKFVPFKEYRSSLDIARAVGRVEQIHMNTNDVTTALYSLSKMGYVEIKKTTNGTKTTVMARHVPMEPEEKPKSDIITKRIPKEKMEAAEVVDMVRKIEAKNSAGGFAERIENIQNRMIDLMADYSGLLVEMNEEIESLKKKRVGSNKDVKALKAALRNLALNEDEDDDDD
jgi:hypothetical protein